MEEIEYATIYEDPEFERILIQPGKGKDQIESVRIMNDDVEGHPEMRSFQANRLEVVELPLTMSTEQYEEWLEDADNKVNRRAKEYRREYGYND